MTRIISSIVATALVAAGSAFAGTSVVSSGKNAPVPPAPSVGCSSDISYNSIEVDWNHGFISEDNLDDTNGIGVKLEVSPFKHVFFTAEGDWFNSEVDGRDVDGWGALVGVGAYLPITENFHFVTDLGGIFEGAKADGGRSVDDAGFYVRPHVRARFNCFEIHTGAKFVHLPEFGDRWEIFAEAFVEVLPHVDVVVGGALDLEDESDSWALKAGLRYKF